MIYTTYLANIKNLPKNTTVFAIVNYMPRQTPTGVTQLKVLAPEVLYFRAYKDRRISLDALFKAYALYLNTNTEVHHIIQSILNQFNDRDVCFVCYEKDPNICHRHILAEYLKTLGVEVRELESNNG